MVAPRHDLVPPLPVFGRLQALHDDPILLLAGRYASVARGLGFAPSLGSSSSSIITGRQGRTGQRSAAHQLKLVLALRGLLLTLLAVLEDLTATPTAEVGDQLSHALAHLLRPEDVDVGRDGGEGDRQQAGHVMQPLVDEEVGRCCLVAVVDLVRGQDG